MDDSCQLLSHPHPPTLAFLQSCHLLSWSFHTYRSCYFGTFEQHNRRYHPCHWVKASRSSFTSKLTTQSLPFATLFSSCNRNTRLSSLLLSRFRCSLSAPEAANLQEMDPQRDLQGQDSHHGPSQSTDHENHKNLDQQSENIQTQSTPISHHVPVPLFTTSFKPSIQNQNDDTKSVKYIMPFYSLVPVQQKVLDNARQDGLSSIEYSKYILLEIMKDLLKIQLERDIIARWVHALEARNLVPMTAEFAAYALSGSWSLAFTSTKLGLKIDDDDSIILDQLPTLQISRIYQVFHAPSTASQNDTSENHSSHYFMENCVSWSVPRWNSRGKWIANCQWTWSAQDYSLDINLVKRKVIIDQKYEIPKEPNFIIQQLERKLPIEFFYPDKTKVQITYTDPDFRISRFYGSKFTSVRNIFVKDTNGE